MATGKITVDVPNTLDARLRLSREKDVFKGELQIKVLGVKDYTLGLTPDETAFLQNLVGRATGGTVVFDPAPPNLLELWKGTLEELKQQAAQDVKTLEEQTTTIEGLRDDLRTSEVANKNALARIESLTNELRDARRASPTVPPPPVVQAETVAVPPPADTVPINPPAVNPPPNEGSGRGSVEDPSVAKPAPVVMPVQHPPDPSVQRHVVTPPAGTAPASTETETPDNN